MFSLDNPGTPNARMEDEQAGRRVMFIPTAAGQITIGSGKAAKFSLMPGVDKTYIRRKGECAGPNRAASTDVDGMQ
jgi:hypothetical protein